MTKFIIEVVFFNRMIIVYFVELNGQDHVEECSKEWAHSCTCSWVNSSR